MNDFMKFCLSIVIPSTMYIGALIGIQKYPQLNDPKITSQEQLETIVKKEKKKLNCNKHISAEIERENEAISKKEESYYILRIGGTFTNKTTVKHEIYHICDGHLEGRISLLEYLFLREPQATLYAAFGWEL